MFETLKSKLYQGNQFIPDVKNAVINSKFRGFPVLQQDLCKNCELCMKFCPTGAISCKPLTIDIGKCIFCGDCQNTCSEGAIKFTNFHKLAVTNRDNLIVNTAISADEFLKKSIISNAKIKNVFGKSLKLRQVSAGGCNGCEMELNACSNVNFDMGRFGIDFVASPRHADGIVITGPITENMTFALENAYNAVPEPKIVILVGTCAISGGVFQKSTAIDRSFLDKYNIDLFVPGCPTHPLTFINGVLDFIGG